MIEKGGKLWTTAAPEGGAALNMVGVRFFQFFVGPFASEKDGKRCSCLF